MERREALRPGPGPGPISAEGEQKRSERLCAPSPSFQKAGSLWGPERVAALGWRADTIVNELAEQERNSVPTPDLGYKALPCDLYMEEETEAKGTSVTCPDAHLW